MQTLLLAIRALRRTPRFTVLVILSLALGIGACTTAFTLVNAFVFAPLPYDDPDRLVQVAPTSSPTSNGLAGDLFQRERVEHWAASGLSTLASITWEYETTLVLQQGDATENLRTHIVAGSWFSTMGVSPIRGRGLVATDDAPGAEPAAVISEDLWRDRFGARDEVLGSTLRASGSQFTIVGVVANRVEAGQSIWVSASSPEQTRIEYVTTLARLAPEATLADARAQLRTLAFNEVSADSVGTMGYGITALPLAGLLQNTSRGSLWLALGLAGVAMLMALTNLVTLFLVRAGKRVQEAAVRTALGADAWQLGQGLFAEVLLLSSAGAVIGLLLSLWGREAALSIMATDYLLPYTPPLDFRVFIFAAVISAGSVLLVGLEPVRVLRRVDLRSLHQRGNANSTARRGEFLPRHAIVAVQVAAAVVVSAASLFSLIHFEEYFGAEIGYDPERIIAARPDWESGPIPMEERANLAFETLTQLEEAPGVAGAGAWYQVGQSYPPRAEHEAQVEGHNEWVGPFWYYAVSPGFAEFLDLRIVRGRNFSGSDRLGSPEVAIVTESAAHEWWPEGDPLGKQIRLGEQGPTLTVVGVVSDFAEAGYMGRFYALNHSRSAKPLMLRPLAQSAVPPIGWVQGSNGLTALEIGVRANADAALARESLRAAIARSIPNLPLEEINTLDDRQRSAYGGRDVIVVRWISSAAAVVTLLLCLLGIIGVVTEQVSRRTREIGIRLALGASGGRVTGGIARDTVITCGLGVAAGLSAIFLIGGRYIGVLMAHVGMGLEATRPRDPSILAAAVVAVFIITMSAALLAAHRATRVNPSDALRQE